jgi:hypothetical protein
MLLSLLFPGLATADRTLKINFAVDNYFAMDITGFATYNSIGGSAWGAWRSQNSLTRTLTDSGPWAIAVKATDTGGGTRFMAGVLVDGVAFTATGGSDTKWKIRTTTPESDWLSPSYDEGTANWISGYASHSTCLSYGANWGDSATYTNRNP